MLRGSHVGTIRLLTVQTGEIVHQIVAHNGIIKTIGGQAASQLRLKVWSLHIRVRDIEKAWVALLALVRRAIPSAKMRFHAKLLRTGVQPHCPTCCWSTTSRTEADQSIVPIHECRGRAGATRAFARPLPARGITAATASCCGGRTCDRRGALKHVSRSLAGNTPASRRVTTVNTLAAAGVSNPFAHRDAPFGLLGDLPADAMTTSGYSEHEHRRAVCKHRYKTCFDANSPAVKWSDERNYSSPGAVTPRLESGG